MRHPSEEEEQDAFIKNNLKNDEKNEEDEVLRLAEIHKIHGSEENFSFVVRDGFKQRICWFLCGVCSLASFNALINTFDYYQYLFPSSSSVSKLHQQAW